MKNENIRKRLSELRRYMEKKKIDAVYIPTADFHGSEYVGAFFRCREFFSGFTGSAGTLVVLKNQAGLWTDGRYFLQAEDQLLGTGITLYKMQQPSVPTVREFLKNTLQEGQTLALDGRTISFGEAGGLAADLEKKGIHVCMEEDPAGTVWERIGGRAGMSGEPVWELSEAYCGEARKDKLARIRDAMQEQKADFLLVSSLDDIAWMLNLRGNDIPCVPVFLSYALIGKEELRLYVSGKFSEELTEQLAEEQIHLFPYDQIYEELSNLGEKESIWCDHLRTNAALMKRIPAHCTVIKKQLPTILMKAVKNPVEIEQERKAHLYDGIAFCKFLCWLKRQELEDGNGEGREGKSLTEISVSEKLEEFRKRQKTYIEPSFEPISAYAEHGAIVHYSATEESNAVLRKENFLLMDTGAHYLEGTTDITRTIVLGKLTREQKQYYTAVLKGNLALGAVKFLYGCCGVNLDVLARSPLWELGLDFNHGTGHGVGYLLNVHEEPNNIRMNARARNSRTTLEEGMITSNEPGVYLAGKYGIRLENLILCKKAEQTEYGQFMEFETLTLVPFEREAILPEMMSEKEKMWLNQYHRTVYKKISPYLESGEKEWLREATKEFE